MQADSETEALVPVLPPIVVPTSGSVSSESSGPVYHPLFASTDGDVVLGSKDGTLFRVHSYTLKTTSGWFRAMFSLPPPQRTPVTPGHDGAVILPATPPPADIIYVDEDSATLEALMRLVCGQPIPQLDTYDVVEPLLYAAEKYDMPGPLSLVRALIMTTPFISDPLRLYTLCCRYGWYPEAQSASTLTLTMNLHASEYKRTLLKLSTTALLGIFELHHNRKDSLRARLNEPPFVNDTGEASCSNCGMVVKYHTWRELKLVIIAEMDVRPMGDTVLEKGLNDWPSAKSCWEAKCDNCERVLYDKKETLRAIKQCIEKLPNKIELPNPMEETNSLVARRAELL